MTEPSDLIPLDPRPACDVSDPVANVARGVVYLDETFPEWWRYVNLDTLNLVDGDNCVLGQLFGGHDGYCDEADKLTAEHGPLGETWYGFCGQQHLKPWTRVILARREEPDA